MQNISPLLIHKPALALSVVTSLLLTCAATAFGQQPPLHYFHSGDMPPGTIGQGQQLRGGPMPGYFQAVEVAGPEGSLISLAVQGQFVEPKSNAALAGMLIGQVYRLKVTNIPGQPGQEIYPTIEVINRLHPPPGQETKFPIPIQLTDEELEMAISGRFVTRVIYLEDPNAPLALAEDPKFQRFFEVRPGEDPLIAADQLGRPMAILRMGSRVPDIEREQTNLGFGYGYPPVRMLEKPINVPRDAGLEQPGPQEKVPRTGLPNAAKQTGRFPRLPIHADAAQSVITTQPRVQR